jgi:outer membrane protein assembly factor BamE (lipoprotein component of BamABCDE complex)
MMVLSLVTVGLWLLGASPVRAADQLWLCQQHDGSALYTTNPTPSENCKEFTPSSGGLTTMPESDQGRQPSEKSQPHKYFEKSAVKERTQEEKPKPQGELEFEKYRMLDTGMTEAQVLTLAGNPKHVFRFGRNIERWVYTEADWLIEITFTSGSVANINWYRPK